MILPLARACNFTTALTSSSENLATSENVSMSLLPVLMQKGCMDSSLPFSTRCLAFSSNFSLCSVLTAVHKSSSLSNCFLCASRCCRKPRVLSPTCPSKLSMTGRESPMCKLWLTSSETYFSMLDWRRNVWIAIWAWKSLRRLLIWSSEESSLSTSESGLPVGSDLVRILRPLNRLTTRGR